MSHRLGADIAAWIVAGLVLVLGGLVVVKPALDHFSELTDSNPFAPRTKQERVVKEAPNQPTVTTTTTKPEAGSFVERALGKSGLLMLRLGVVALAAFLAGATVQRAVLANFSFELGPLKVPDLVEASKSGIAGLKDELARVEREAKDRDAQTSETVAGVLDATQAVEGRVAHVEENITP